MSDDFLPITSFAVVVAADGSTWIRDPLDGQWWLIEAGGVFWQDFPSEVVTESISRRQEMGSASPETAASLEEYLQTHRLRGQIEDYEA